MFRSTFYFLNISLLFLLAISSCKDNSKEDNKKQGSKENEETGELTFEGPKRGPSTKFVGDWEDWSWLIANNTKKPIAFPSLYIDTSNLPRGTAFITSAQQRACNGRTLYPGQRCILLMNKKDNVEGTITINYIIDKKDKQNILSFDPATPKGGSWIIESKNKKPEEVLNITCEEPKENNEVWKAFDWSCRVSNISDTDAISFNKDWFKSSFTFHLRPSSTCNFPEKKIGSDFVLNPKSSCELKFKLEGGTSNKNVDIKISYELDGEKGIFEKKFF